MRNHRRTKLDGRHKKKRTRRSLRVSVWLKLKTELQSGDGLFVNGDQLGIGESLQDLFTSFLSLGEKSEPWGRGWVAWLLGMPQAQSGEGVV